MSIDTERFRLTALPVEIRAVLTLFVVSITVGYAVALLNLYLTYAPVDGRRGLSAEDMKRAFYGNRTNTKLARVIDGGSMEQYLRDPNDKGRILSWIQDGAQESKFATIQPILAQSCTPCHQPGGSAAFTPLVTFKEVAATAQIDRGESFPMWARVAHTHLQSLALVFLALGLIFALCTFPARLKFLVMAAPFAALFADFGSRALSHLWPPMVYVMMLSGGVMSLSTLVMAGVILRELWILRPRKEAGAPLKEANAV
jgi:hypothetical protein